jgi:hypothetical protein
MRRRFGIPLTMLLLFIAAYAEQATNLPMYGVLIAAGAIWAAWDSHKIGLAQYDSSLGMAPVGVFFVVAMFFPITFPWYLKVKYQVANGEVPQRSGVSSRLKWSLGILVFALVATGVFFVFSPEARLMFSLGKDLMTEYRMQFNIAMNDTDLTISVANDKLPGDSTAREAFARRVARTAVAKMDTPAPVKVVAVVLQEKKETGGVAVTRDLGKFRWTVAELRGQAPPRIATKSGAPAVRQAGTPANTASLGAATRTPAVPVARKVANVAPAPAPSAFQRLTASDPAVRWVRDSALIADVDCDQSPDTVVIGRARAEMHVGLARAADPLPQILVFDAGQATGMVHSARAKFALESLDSDPADRGLAGIEGFSRSATCKGITLGDRGPRQLHLLWSRKTQHLEWFQR